MKLKKLNALGIAHTLLAAIIVLGVGVGGAAYIVMSHAQVPPEAAGKCSIVAKRVNSYTVDYYVTVTNVGNTGFKPSLYYKSTYYHAGATQTGSSGYRNENQYWRTLSPNQSQQLDFISQNVNFLSTGDYVNMTVYQNAPTYSCSVRATIQR
ncbi:MAG: hypothetical protein JWO41_813 [Candidatus Saccharibacteria bacterium]|nr:hypothetical protein [Candidatus Saccharibacteria bacterium]